MGEGTGTRAATFFLRALTNNFLKDWIRLVKFWKTRFIWPAGGARMKPSSYFLELLTIYLVQKTPALRESPAAFLGAFIDYLKEVDKLDVHFNLTPRIPISMRKCVAVLSSLLSRFRLPFVCDPANPTNNVASFLLNTTACEALKRAASHGVEVFSKKYASIDLDATRIEAARAESDVRSAHFKAM